MESHTLMNSSFQGHKPPVERLNKKFHLNSPKIKKDQTPSDIT